MKTVLLLALCSLPAFAGAIVSMTDTGSPCITTLGVGTGFTGGDGSTTAVARASAEYLGAFAVPVICHVDVLADLQTPGPVRPGFLSISLFGVAGSSGFPPAVGDLFFLNGSAIGTCGLIGCNPGVNAVSIPISLGTSFQVEVMATASTSLVGASDGDIQATIQAYEFHDDGFGLIRSYAPISFAIENPEPATLPLIALGLLGIALVRKYYLPMLK